VTTAQEGGRLSVLRTGRLYPPGNTPGTHLLEAESKGFYVNEKSTNTSWDQTTSDLLTF